MWMTSYSLSDNNEIETIKAHLKKYFVTKDLGRPRYFLGIEFAYNETGVVLSQRKYAMDLLSEVGMLGCRPASIPVDIGAAPELEGDKDFEDLVRFRKLVGKLIYLTVTRPDISYVVGVVSQFMHQPKYSHWNALLKILHYIKSSPGKGLWLRKNGHIKIEGYSDADYAGSICDRRSTSGYCTYVGGNLVTWRSKKQNVVARSSAEAEYRAMAHTTCELMWVKSFLGELGFSSDKPMTMHCDNQSAIHIANNPIFHERTKHIEVDCHFIRDVVLSKKIITPHVSSQDQIADIFTKALNSTRFKLLCDKLGMIDIYAPA